MNKIDRFLLAGVAIGLIITIILMFIAVS